MFSSAPAPRPSTPPQARRSERPIDGELRLLREAHARLPSEDVHVVADELRRQSEAPRAGSAAAVDWLSVPPPSGIPTDLARTLEAPPGTPLPRTPRKISTSPEGTRGRDVDTVVYYDHQHATWTSLLALQAELSRERAHPLYARGRGRMDAFDGGIPSLADVDAWLWQNAGWNVVRANGYVDSRAFLSFVSRGLFPCMDLLRHKDEMLYSPEPDMYHDIVGHLPMLCDRQFGEYTRTFGRAGTNARHAEHLVMLDRIYWFTMEFGLAHEESSAEGQGRAYGAALLTGLGELMTSNGASVTRRPFRIEDVIATEIDVHRPNEVLYVTRDFDDLLGIFVDWAKSEKLL